MDILKNKKVILIIAIIIGVMLFTIIGAAYVTQQLNTNKAVLELKKRILDNPGNRYSVKKGSLALELDIDGNIEPLEVTQLVFLTAGNIEHMYVKEGDIIKKGQLLATLYSDNLIKKDMEYAKDIENAKVSGSKFDLEILELERKINKKNITYTKLYAPHDGMLVSWRGEKNMVVKVNDIVGILYDLSAYVSEVEINETDINNIKIGDRVSVEFSALPKKTFYGQVDYISTLYETQDGIASYPVKILFKDQKEVKAEDVDPAQKTIMADREEQLKLAVAKFPKLAEAMEKFPELKERLLKNSRQLERMMQNPQNMERMLARFSGGGAAAGQAGARQRNTGQAKVAAANTENKEKQTVKNAKNKNNKAKNNKNKKNNDKKEKKVTSEGKQAKEKKVKINIAKGSVPSEIKPGFTYTGKIYYGVKNDVLVVPKLSVSQESGEFYAAKIVNEEIEKSYVEIGIETNDFYEITDGLALEDVILRINPIDLIEQTKAMQPEKKGFNLFGGNKNMMRQPGGMQAGGAKGGNLNMPNQKNTSSKNNNKKTTQKKK